MPKFFSEDALIQRYFAPIAFAPAALGLHDDAACLAVPEGYELVITCDTIIENVHFFSEDPIGVIAQKALRVNLSDLAAKAAQPIGFMLALGMPQRCFSQDWLEPFSQALFADAKHFNCPLLGGDTTRTPNDITITITAFGSVPIGRMVKRTTARAGDSLYVTGTIGDAALGLKLFNHNSEIDTIHFPYGFAQDHQDYLEMRRLIPQPRLEITPILQKFATAALDISDGFAGDCMKLLSFSNLGIEIQCDDVPLSDVVRDLVLSSSSAFSRAEVLNFWQTLLSGGDDYEVLFTIAPEHEADFITAAREFPFAVTRLGHVTDTGKLQFFHNGHLFSLNQYSYSHL